MAKRMTRVMADHAAEECAKIAYDKKIERAEKARKDFGDELIKKYIPKPVLDCGKEFGECFESHNAFFARIERNGWDSRKEIPSNLINPTRKYLTISEPDFSKAKDLTSKQVGLVYAKRSYFQNVSDALVTLKTEARIKEQFPEALPYLNFAATNLPTANYSKLRQLLK